VAVVSIAGDDDDGDDDAAPERPSPRETREGSRPTEGPAGFEISPVEEFRVVYRVDDYAGGDEVTSTEDVRVRRPFESRSERKRGEPPGGERTSLQVGRLGLLSLPGGNTGTIVVATPPEPAAGDFRYDIALDELVASEEVVRREWRKVADTRCRVHRVLEPITSGQPKKWMGDDDNYTDVCVSEDGIVLEELWVTDGQSLRRRLAVDIEDASGLTDEMLEITGQPLPVDQGGGSTVLVEEGAPAPVEARWRFEPAPAGFTKVGRYAVVPATLGAAPAPAGPALVEVWSRGADLVLLEQGATGPAPPDDVGEQVDLGGLGSGRLVIGLRVNEVFALPEGGPPVRVRGTVAPDELTRLARSVIAA
ncbi:MAG TPA: hypothetical protein VFV35_02430, partial [Acidimicrobiales bacterium]|nr:hypothetical protein [Acidimicrobiales bacterium]